MTDEFGALPFIYGTVVTSLLALLHLRSAGSGRRNFPVRTGAGATLRRADFLIELLAAVPSVIYGLLAIFTLVPLMRRTSSPAFEDDAGIPAALQGPFYGVGYLTAGWCWRS